MIIAKLTLKQKRFADEYIISGNAYQSAIKAGYSKQYSKARSSELLENVGIKSYMAERMKLLESKTIATQEEVLSYLTSVMRGEQREQILRGEGEGYQSIIDIDVGAKDRIKAAELLGKSHGTWTEKKEIEHKGEVAFVDDIS